MTSEISDEYSPEKWEAIKESILADKDQSLLPLDVFKVGIAHIELM